MTNGLRALSLVLVGLLVGTAWGQTPTALEDVLRALRAGGYVIVFRHGATHPDQADTDPLNLDNVAKQRQLNDKGRADAKAVGDAFRRAGVPIGKSYSSRFYRAVETARLISGKEPQATLDVPIPEARAVLTLSRATGSRVPTARYAPDRTGASKRPVTVPE